MQICFFIEEDMKTVAILDDHILVARGLQSTLKESNLFSEINIFTEYREFWIHLQKHKPDLIIVDQVLNEKNGVEIILSVKSKYTTIKTILYSSVKDPEILKKCKDHGINGYLFKAEPESIFMDAVKQIMNGEDFFSKMPEPKDKIYSSTFSTNPFHALTERELKVVKGIARGLTYQEIGERLNISPRTVNVFRTNISRKIGIVSAPKLLHEAVIWGLMKDEDFLD